MDMSAPGPDGQTDPLDHLSPEEKQIFVKFLVLIRDNYRKADKAAHFLERRANIVNTSSMANLRDILSHMATLLDPNTPSQRRRDQLASAEEHLRRAIIEPYEIGLGDLTQKWAPVYDSYRGIVLSLNKAEGFRTAPSRTEIENRLRDIDDLAEKGKYAKGRNLWDEQWETGVQGLVEAYDQLSDLYLEVEDWVREGKQFITSEEQRQKLEEQRQKLEEQARTSSHHTRLHRWGIAWAIIGIAMGLVGGFLIAKYV
jgi:hypothetical protein